MHIPVLLKEVLDSLDIKKGETVIDCNVNRAGHSVEIAKLLGDSGTIVGIDLDTQALTEAQRNFSKLGEHPRICLIHDNFRNLDEILKDSNVEKADKILFDLGLSSEELDISSRGFTFQKDQPLIMTYQSKSKEETLTAKDVLNLWSEEVLADIIYYYGGERYARRIAKQIILTRKEKEIETTFELVECIKKATPSIYQRGKTHFATKTFQAIRIAVNDEIEALKEALEKSFDRLNKDGRLSVITFHSLEDKVVKNFESLFILIPIANA